MNTYNSDDCAAGTASTDDVVFFPVGCIETDDLSLSITIIANNTMDLGAEYGVVE
jgi:hypothetical protein